ncbi:testis-expressed protein 2 isoform X2 [Periophthalmus magnuspinnatus]|uniref:testis-expressed protein 2 isoform X2 n=1 Tax=Periophthalmus magnuspinnatus TaxID=409849 RepID=UPI00243700BA|nr:testis-expressed protein 2 isoform X2 [Periophthalmus magnuspinnatus]
MAASGPNRPGEREVRESHAIPPTLSPKSASTNGTKRHVPRGIVIQLTGTEGEWDSLDSSELIFSLDEDYPTISLTKERQLSVNDDLLLHAPPCHVPQSSSTPSSLGNCSGTSFLSPGPSSPTHRPLTSLVKSLSSELEIKEGATLRPKPLLNLVKSISTEISRSEPEISQSKSDSRLNLHLWKQLTQPKKRSNGDSRTAPPSPCALSPSGEGGKGSFFKMELEDTKRKFSEAVHEHSLSSMFQKIMREESGGSPKHNQKKQPVLSRSMAQDGSTDSSFVESPGKSAKRSDDIPHVFEWPPFRQHHKTCPFHHNRDHQKDEELEVFTDDDVVQISVSDSYPIPDEPPIMSTPLPHMSLFCIGVLSYGYFILPLGPYFSGMAFGVALGFLIGLLLIRLSTSRSNCVDRKRRKTHNLLGEAILTGATVRTESDTLKGWMNEVYEYDPETYHPSQSHSVFATLEGSCLCLHSPRNNISRRATYGERLPDAAFMKTRCFHLTNSKVFLLPSVLAQKRQWNPKYPLCLQLSEGGSSLQTEAWSEEDTIEQPLTPNPFTLYLFGRTGREKEEWYRHFLLASEEAHGEREADRCVGRSGDVRAPLHTVVSSRGSSRVGSEEDPSTPPVPVPTPMPQSSHSSIRAQPALNYHSYMSQLLCAAELTPLWSPGASSTAECTCDVAERPEKGQTAWINGLIGRIFWDFLREKYYADMVSTKIQKKLSTIRLPYFMNELTVTEMDLGTSMPLITATSKPEINPRGLWLELQLVYNGGLQMTLQTKFNLFKLGKEGSQEAEFTPHTKTSRCRPVLSVLADSDEESSSAGSSDEEELLLSEPQGPVGDKGPSTATNEGVGGGKTGRKILRFVDKIAKSKYFQKAAENEFIKKKFEEMSNTPLLLTVEVQELSGALVVNVPPPPTDRIWYSFCSPPKLDLHVRPKLGEREVTFCHVTEWIEKKLQEEFQVFVFPNMDDICVPLMHCGLQQPHSSSTEPIQKTPMGGDQSH